MTVPGATDTVSTFQAIERAASARWDQLRDGHVPLITVGTATCGRSAGALEVLEAIKGELERLGQDAHVIEVGCMGHCYAEPLVTIAKPGYPPIAYGYVTPMVAQRLVADFIAGDDPSLEFALGALEENDLIPSIYDLPRFAYERHILLANCGHIDPEDIDHYIANGGYRVLAQALQMAPEDIVEEVRRSGLRGMGGAGFPTARKWDLCRSTKGRTKYLICNGDEGDPGAFMDRAILESDPHSVIEGMIVSARAVGARHGYIYVRAEYPLAVRRVQMALDQAKERGLMGRHILGGDFSFDIELFQGSGAFVCGEETALISSLEGRAGVPRYRPPFPAERGLNGRPTLIDNVKTLAFVPRIVGNGAEWFASTGTERSKGTAVFALAGKVINTGLAEVPMGTTLRQVIFEVGGGIPKGKRFKAVQIGGPSGGCLPESALDLPIDFDSLTEAGAMMGSGGMVVLDEDDCMVEAARYFLDFTQRESCGKCTPCRLGTKHMLAILEDLTKGRGRMEDIETLKELAEDVKASSLCGLGQTAPNPVLSTLRHFRDEYEAHVSEQCCPARMCLDLIAYYIVPEKCERSCDACVGTCTVDAIYTGKKRVKVVDQEKCVKCGTCLDACPPQYNAIVKISPLRDLPEAIPPLEQKG
ncbi:MAG: NADH-quinone oxidoreductase subunit NuoF [Chloroflexota bacterium]|nr:NADH-quinone oxidoreductase subunit NuoF [Chloroflexota bacterium]